MISELDIWRSAQVMLKRYGDDATVEATKRADEFLDTDNTSGVVIWRRILKAIEELQRRQPKEDEAVH